MGIAGASGVRIARRAGCRSRRSAPTSASQVHSLVCAVDCGRAINPGLVRQQVEGALIWALGQATATVARMARRNAGSPAVRWRSACHGSPSCPNIDVVIIPSSEAPGGVNGLGAIPLAPAVANAIFAGDRQEDAHAAVRSYVGG